MAVSIQDITQTLDSFPWGYHVESVTFRAQAKEHVHTTCATQDYVDSRGKRRLHLVIHTKENGKLLVIAAPHVRTMPDLSDAQRLSLLDVLNDAVGKYKLVQPYWDPVDGELGVRIEVPFEDGEFHPSILKRGILNLVNFFELYTEQIDTALSQNPIEINLPEDEDMIMMTKSEMFERFERYRREQDAGV